MAISKEKKQELVAGYSEKFARSRAILAADYRGLTVADISALRNKLREQDCEFMVVKNTLAKLALQEASLPVPQAFLEGPTAVGVCYQEVVAPAKTLTSLANEVEVFSIKGGILGRSEIDPEDIVVLSQLPSMELLLSRLMGQMQAPVGTFVRGLNGIVQGLANVFSARIDQLEGAKAG